MNRKALAYSTRLTCSDVAGLIEAITEGLKEGVLKVQKSNECLEVPAPRVVDLDISAQVGGEGVEFKLAISWRIRSSEVPEEPSAQKRKAPARKTISKAKKA